MDMITLPATGTTAERLPDASPGVVGRADGAPRPRFDMMDLMRRFATVLFLVVLMGFFQVQNDNFLSARNLLNILTDVSIYGIVAIGMTFVIIAGGVDLAVGSTLAFASIVAAAVMKLPSFAFAPNWLVALVLAPLIGTAIGYLHGKAITLLAVPAFIVTLGGMTIWRGATLLVNDGGPINGFDAAMRWWGTGRILGLPMPVLIFALVAALGYVMQRYTRYGRHIYAVGGNAEAARLSGLDVRRIETGVYVLIGFLSGLAGFLLMSRLGSAEAIAGTGMELRVIASVVIGGASLAGGVGGIGGTIIGALLIGVLTNGLVVMGVNSYYQQIVIGVIIVLAVAFDTYTKKHRR